MTLFRVRSWGSAIEEVEYERTTEMFAVKTNGRRDALRTEHDALFRTRQEAINWKRAQLTRKVEQAELALAQAERALKEFEMSIAESARD